MFCTGLSLSRPFLPVISTTQMIGCASHLQRCENEHSSGRENTGRLASAVITALVLFNLSHKLGKGHRVRQRDMPIWIRKRMDMPAAGVICAKGSAALADQGKCHRACLLVIWSLDKIV